MANHILIDEDITQLLQEADCSDEFIQEFLTAMDAENIKNQLSLLRTQRGRQLNRLHEEEEKLDRLLWRIGCLTFRLNGVFYDRFMSWGNGLGPDTTVFCFDLGWFRSGRTSTITLHWNGSVGRLPRLDPHRLRVARWISLLRLDIRSGVARTGFVIVCVEFLLPDSVFFPSARQLFQPIYSLLGSGLS